MLNTAIDAAHAAADVLRLLRQEPREIHEKAPRDIVTDADLASNDAIVNVIRHQHPSHQIVTEESEMAVSIATWQPEPDTYYWIIDPIDGTTNFARGNPSWSISIALAKGSQVVAGVVYDVVRDDLFAAERGGGAKLNGQPIHTKPTDLAWALTACDWSTIPEKRQFMLHLTNAVLPRVRSLRCWGTTALALAHIAAGYLDTYVNLSMKPWDVAAGALLVEEAGGRISGLAGEPWHLTAPDLLATNGNLHNDMLAILQELPKP